MKPVHNRRNLQIFVFFSESEDFCGGAYVRRLIRVLGSNRDSGMGFGLNNVPMSSDPRFRSRAPPITWLNFTSEMPWISATKTPFLSNIQPGVGRIKIWKNGKLSQSVVLYAEILIFAEKVVFCTVGAPQVRSKPIFGAPKIAILSNIWSKTAIFSRFSIGFQQ